MKWEGLEEGRKVGQNRRKVGRKRNIIRTDKGGSKA